MVPVEQLGDLLQRLAASPAFPHQRLLAFRVIDSLAHLQHSRCLWQASVCCIDQLNPPSEADIAQNHTVKPKQPVSIAKAWQLCRNALSQRYGDSDSDVHRVRVSDNRTANRRVDAIISEDQITAHAYCIVEPSGQTETHILSQDAWIRSSQ